MERVIKFRVWCKNTKHFTDIPFYSCGGRQLLWLHSGNQIEISNLPEDGYVIQQFTGLLDKNNNEIFEGDIVKFKFQVGDFAWEFMTPEEEKANDKANGKTFIGLIAPNILTPINFEILVGSPENTHTVFPLISAQNSEIIGNIFENPELLKS